MSRRFWFGRARVVVMVLASAAWYPAQAAAQAPTSAPAPGEVASDPIKCWWKTSVNAVHIGERFTLTLTCGIVQTSRITVVPNLSQLEPTSVQLTPFEVYGGTRHEDIVAPPWRYVQYDYTVRLVSEGYFGQDINIPSLTITYNIQSPGAGEAEGRDQFYALPALPMRVVSLVPNTATDIRDVSRETFADIEARRSRATAELIAASIFFGFGVVLLGFAAVRAVSHYRRRAPAVAKALSARHVLAGCLRRVRRLKSDVGREGWTPELAGRALAAFRVAGAVALDRPVAETLVDRNVAGREGQLVLRKGMFRSKRALVSAPTTADTIAKRLASGNGLDARHRAVLEEIHGSLQVFNAARYGLNDQLDATTLDATLENGTSAIRRLRFSKLWPRRMAASVAKSATDLGGMVWSRSDNS